jgi:hypothetical protein
VQLLIPDKEIDCRWHLHRKPATKKVKASGDRSAGQALQIDGFRTRRSPRRRRTGRVLAFRCLLAHNKNNSGGAAGRRSSGTSRWHSYMPKPRQLPTSVSTPPMTERLHDKTRLWVALKAQYGLRKHRAFQEHLAEVVDPPRLDSVQNRPHGVPPPPGQSRPCVRIDLLVICERRVADSVRHSGSTAR